MSALYIFKKKQKKQTKKNKVDYVADYLMMFCYMFIIFISLTDSIITNLSNCNMQRSLLLAY